MRRRAFIGLIGGAAAWPLSVRAQQPTGRVYRIGYLTISSREQQLHLIKAFEDGLQNLGYRVGENVIIDYRFANGQMERLPALAEGLLGVDVIVTGANPNTVAVMKATKTIPWGSVSSQVWRVPAGTSPDSPRTRAARSMASGLSY